MLAGGFRQQFELHVLLEHADQLSAGATYSGGQSPQHEGWCWSRSPHSSPLTTLPGLACLVSAHQFREQQAIPENEKGA